MFDVFPADEFGLFEAPSFTTVAVVAGSPNQLIGADPTRVALIFGCPGAAIVLIGPTGSTGANKGLPIGSSTPIPLTLSWKDYGPLVQCGWEAFGGPINVTVVSVSLRRPPAMSGYLDLFAERTAPAVIESAGRRPRASSSAGRRPLPAGVRRILAKRCPRVFGGSEE